MIRKEAGKNVKPAKLTVKRKTIRDLETTRSGAEKVRGGAYTPRCGGSGNTGNT